MMTLKYFFGLVLIGLIGCKSTDNLPETQKNTRDYNELSENFLLKIKNNEDTSDIQRTLAKSTIGELERALDTNNKKLAFWVNIYNAYIQVLLKENPDLYNDRGEFFKKEQIPIAGDTISFAKIEHGIIRKSQWEYGLGYIRKWFPGKLERKLRVDERDYRIHFALNCGAKDCPPVAIYEWERLDEQFSKGTTKYLQRTTDYDKPKKEVAVTSLFNWFRGDFGGKSGVKDILKKEGLIPTTKGIDINYKNYDWTLDLDNFVDL
ncbi:DUF547 domain-containing protein [Maribacter sp. PR1]|uniref:DUF547 domain-containing protein n=1 Tax=Maribacter cobaltidurans TaxID=1178778 RepID=A0ABU7IV43_9FLAO|nr:MULTISPECIES: DUF547 domain-containing protein [Maribacter]MDC6389428.1 DUF547 domain-containing protein [Maribacter sp. PR1]MEE1976817.1 DUF547 domain-containing protein [Maribacter cobaltidurans]